MSTTKHRRVVRTGRPSVAAHLHGREKLRGASSGIRKPHRYDCRKLLRPDTSVVNEAIRVFAIGRNQAGFWVARDCDGSVCGLFLSKAGAVRFAKHTSGADGCALMFVSNGLELKPHTSMARAWHNIMPMKTAKLIARFKLEIEKLLIRARRAAAERDLIKQDLYWNRYPHRSKSDDDLPIERDIRGDTAARGE